MKLPHPRLRVRLMAAGFFAMAAFIALLAAWSAVGVIERTGKADVERALLIQGEDWAGVETDGLQVVLSGVAPTESARFGALSAAASEVDANRVIDTIEVPAPRAITPPQFAIEILRNDSGISMIGLIPAETDRVALGERVQVIDPLRPVTDLLESADYPVPDLWNVALDLAVEALALLPRSKISVDATRVAVEAIADSADQKLSWERQLAAAAPGGVRLSLDISAPRPVITPFTLRFTLDEEGPRFDACTAHTEAGRAMILDAGRKAGTRGRPDCTIGLGVPSPDWPDAVARGVAAVAELGGGSLTFSDADVTLVAAAGTPQASYDRVIGELEADLPDVFSLHAVLPDPVSISGTGEGEDGPPEFVATLSPEGQVQLRGRVADDQERSMAESYARARFGMSSVYAAMRLDPGLPRGWSVRTLAGLEALSHLASGVLVVQPDVVDLRGASGDKGASAEVSRVLSEKLGEAEDFRVNIRYEESLDPTAALPSAEECVVAVNQAMAGAKITFAPGSAEIEATSGSTVDNIAEIVKTCPDVAMEIGGYTDSQGSEDMNRALSQRRADAVLSALLSRRVLTSNLSSHGYGEDSPIADNDTEAGREENRRIEFRLIGAGVATGEDDAGEGLSGALANSEAAATPPRPRPDAATGDEDADEAPVDEAPADETAAEEAPADDAPAQDVPGDQPEADAPAADETPDATPDDTAPDAPDAGSDVPETDATNAEADPAATGPAPLPDAAPDATTDTTSDTTSDAAPDTAPAADPAAEEPTARGEPAATPAPDMAGPMPAPAAADAPADAADAVTPVPPATAGGAPEVAPAADAPLPRPPVVVHPELEGIRPQPRPANP